MGRGGSSSSRGSSSSSRSSSRSSSSYHKPNSNGLKSSDNTFITIISSIVALSAITNSVKKYYETDTDDYKKFDEFDKKYLIKDTVIKDECKELQEKYLNSVRFYPNDYLRDVLKNELNKCENPNS